MGRFSFSMDEGCGMCGNLTGKGENAEQGSPPELRYIVDKRTGKGTSLQCCLQCCKKIDENARAAAAAKKHQEELEKREQEEARQRIFVAQADNDERKLRTAKRTADAPKQLRGYRNANGKSNKRTAKKGRAK